MTTLEESISEDVERRVYRDTEDDAELASEEFEIGDHHARTRAHRTLWYTEWLRKAPFCLCIGAFLLCIAVSGSAFARSAQGTRLDVDRTLNSFVAVNHRTAQQKDAWTVAAQRFAEVDPMFFAARKRHVEMHVEMHVGSPVARKRVEDRPRGYFRRWSVSLVFESIANGTDADGQPLGLYDKSTPLEQKRNLLTQQDIEWFRAVEQYAIQADGYTSRCWIDLDRDPRDNCRMPGSLLWFMYPSGNKPDGRGTRLVPNIERALQSVAVAGVYLFTDRRFDKNTPVSSVFRIEFHFGAPLNGFLTKDDRDAEQTALFVRWADVWSNTVMEAARNGTIGGRAMPGHMTVFAGGEQLSDHHVLNAIEHDARLAIGAIILVFLLMLFNVGSLFIAVTGVVQVLLSFPLAFFVYRHILGFERVGILNAIALFIIIGIGVDDVFIFYNTFRQCADLPDEGARLAKTFRRAAKSTLITSFTTAVAFGVNVFSSIPALRLFGWYMILLVIINYLLVLSFFLLCLIVWDRHIRPTEEKIFAPCSSVSASLGDRVRSKIHTPNKPPSVLGPAFSNGDRFFYVRYSEWLYKARYPLVVIAGVLLAAAILATASLRTSQSVPNLFPVGSPLQNWVDYSIGNFYRASSIQVNAEFGCDGILGSGAVVDSCMVCGGSNNTCIGEIGCDGLRGGAVFDRCGVCGGDNACERCQEQIDLCGVCGGNNACLGCDGRPNTPKCAPTVPPSPSPFVTLAPSPRPVTNAPTPATRPMCADLGGLCSFQADCCSFSCVQGVCVPQTRSPTPSPTPRLPTPQPTPRRTLAPTPRPTEPPGCDGVPGSRLTYDLCGVCGGTSDTCFDCRGTLFGTAVRDQCGVCGGDDSSCVGCDGVVDSGVVFDECGICGGDNACVDCDGVINSGKRYDLCGVCGGSNACARERTSAQLLAITVQFGIVGMDRKNIAAGDIAAGELGEPVYDLDFDFENPAAQQAMQTLQDTLQSHTPQLIRGQVDSFLPQFVEWLRVRGLSFPLSTGATARLCTFVAERQAFRDDLIFNTSLIVPPTDQERKRQLSSGSLCRAPDLRLVAARFKTLSFQLDPSTPSFAALPVYEMWEETLETYNRETGEPSFARASHMSDLWVRMVTEVNAVRGVIYGIIVASLIALVSLLIFTSNFLVALLALMSQLGSLFCMLGVYWLAGWTMGTIEAISITVLVGLSVDYFFHLAEAYSISSEYGRRERTRDALTRMGVGVLSGAVTTLVASMMLLGSEVEIFFKFGLIVVVNTFLAIVWSYGFFCAYLVTIGPSGDYGSMHKFWAKVLGCIKPAPSQKSVHRVVAADASETASADGSEVGRLHLSEASGAGSSEEEEIVRDGRVPVLDDDEDVTDDVTEEPTESELSFEDMRTPSPNKNKKKKKTTRA